MRGQLEKLESDQAHLQQLGEFITRTLQLLEGAESVDLAEVDGGESTAIQQIIEAQEEERRKISRQIHDGPAQALSNFILQTEIAVRLFDIDPERARAELSNLKAAAAATFSHIRDYIFDLRPMMLDDLGLVPTVRRYTEAFKEKSGLNIGLVVTGTERRLESHREVLIFRAIQELLGNIREHAQATQVKINVDLDDHQVRVTVEDNGRGFEAHTLEETEAGEHIGGLLTLQGRIDKFGGALEITSADQGTRISFSIPTGD
jgi:two-component system, NarL family, sensor histidine kinase DegS